VLATVSSGYPPLRGRLSTCYSPVRHFQAYCYALTFDLHVLGTPPAFILSQDQTLRIDPKALFLTRSSHSLYQSSFRTRTSSYHSLVVNVHRFLQPCASSGGTFEFITPRPPCQVCVALILCQFCVNAHRLLLLLPARPTLPHHPPHHSRYHPQPKAQVPTLSHPSCAVKFGIVRLHLNSCALRSQSRLPVLR
jgi:hypothetical protein